MSNQWHVLELGDSTATAYAAKLLGDEGADVIKVEPPQGSTARRHGPFPEDEIDLNKSGWFISLNINKRSMTLDLTDQDASDQLARLLNWADIVVHSYPATIAADFGLDAPSLLARNPHQVILAITPFGQTGPHANFAATELTMNNAGGWANLCPATRTDPAMPPLKVFGDQCSLMTGISGAMTALALARQARTGASGDCIDLSVQAYVASVLEVGVPAYSYKQQVATRSHQRSLIPWRIFQALDAPIFIVCIEQDQWERLVNFMGNPDWATMDVFTDQASRAENQDMVHLYVQEFVSNWRALDLYHAAQEQRICVAPVLDLAQMADNEHLRSRGFFTQIEQPDIGSIDVLAPAVLTEKGRRPLRLAAPTLGQHTREILNTLEAPQAQHKRRQPASAGAETPLPLNGVRVLDLTWAWAGPFASMNLAHLGAEVIRLESGIRPDLYRRLPVYEDHLEPTLNISGMFNQWNQGKSSVAIDLSQPEGIELVRSFIRESDVVVQNFATGVMDRLGLGFEQLQALNPGIILASISGYGQSGPYKDYMGYGPAIPPLTGLAAATGFLDGEPEELGLSMPDPTAGITAALAIVAALDRRDTTGRGEHLDVSLWDATGVLVAEAWMGYSFNRTLAKPMGNRDANICPQGVFPCTGEDNWVSIACATDEQWGQLASVVDDALQTNFAAQPALATIAGRKAKESEIEHWLGQWTMKLDRWQATNQLQALAIAAFPTFTTADVVNDEHLNARGFIERLDHPEAGTRAHTGIPWRFHQRANGVRSPAPCLGADTDYHLRNTLGLNESEIQSLHDNMILQ